MHIPLRNIITTWTLARSPKEDASLNVDHARQIKIFLNTPKELCTRQGGGQGQPQKNQNHGHSTLVTRSPARPPSLLPAQLPAPTSTWAPSTFISAPPSFWIFFGFALLMTIAMKLRALVWLSTTWRQPCICNGCWVWRHRIWRCSKECNESKRGEQFYGGVKAHGLDLGYEGEGKDIASKNAMDPREENNFMAAAKHID